MIVMSHINVAMEAFDDATDVRQAAPRQVVSVLWGTLAAPVTRMTAAVAEWQRIARGIAELNALSDHMLKDIGIARHDIVRIVRNGRDATNIRA
jgi:uncharacterized protein YjiS (DUF1127 family)